MFVDTVKALRPNIAKSITKKDDTGTTKENTLFVGLVSAIVIFKRLAKKIRARRRYRNQRKGVKSALFKKVLQSNIQVRDAVFGRPVITLTADAIDDYREYMDRRQAEFKASKSATTSRRHATRPSTFAIPTSIAKSEYEHRNKGIPIVVRLRSLSSGIFNPDTTETATEQGDQPAKNSAALTSFFESVVEKNQHLKRRNGNDTKARSAATLRADVRSMKRMDIQDALAYNPGTAVYFGATIALQSRHGGFLSFVHGAEIKASAPKLLPSTRFVIWNCDQLNDFGVLRYGDAVWLQAGQHEILGAHYSGKATNNEQTRKIHPALINCRKGNFFKAQQYGRWIVLNQENPSSQMGEQVLHHDNILLEQEWYFLGSKTPYDSFMEKKMSFEKVTSGGGEDVFRPSAECSWRMHLVALPSDDNVDNRCRQYLLTEAQTQVKASASERLQKEASLHVPLRKKISPHLTESYVVDNQLAHKATNVLVQRNLLKKYDKQLKKGFVDPLQCGRKEFVDTHSKMYESVDGGSSRTPFSRRAQSAGSSRRRAATGGTFGGLVSAKSIIEEQYWDVAEQVLTDTRSWSQLPSRMDRYFARDMKKKEIAARIIQSFWKRYVPITSWRKTFIDIDFSRSIQFDKYGIDGVNRDGHKKLTNYSTASKVVSYFRPKDRLASAESEDENDDKSVASVAVSENDADGAEKDEKVAKKEETAEHYELRMKIKRVESMNARQRAKECIVERDIEVGSNDVIEKRIESAADDTLPPALEPRPRRRSSIKFERPETAPAVMPVSEPPVPAPEALAELNKNHLPKVLHAPLVPLSIHTTNGETREKSHKKKEDFRGIMNSLVKTDKRAHGLPQDVFSRAQGGLSLSDSVKFLSIGSSTPGIFKDLKAKKRSKDRHGKKRI